MYENSVLFAFGLTIAAGLSTGIGSVIGLMSKRTNMCFLSVTLGFSAGVMIYVSFAEMLTVARENLVGSLGNISGNWVVTLAFFGGMLITAAIERLVPSQDYTESGCTTENKGNLMRMGVMSALAIAIHNFPEGLATFTSALQSQHLGYAMAFAVALHNIPEGLAVSIPIYFATGSRRRAFWMSFVSGIFEPVGALIGYMFLLKFFNDVVSGVLFAMVAGITVFISLDELLPSAREYGEPHHAIYGLIAGMFVMAVSLMLFL